MGEAQLFRYLMTILDMCQRQELEQLLRTHIDPGPLRRVVYGVILDRLTEERAL